MAEIISGNYDALAWVQEELQESLESALQSLTRYIDDKADSTALDSCITQLHQTNGTVEMLNLFGAQSLTSEMMASANALYNADSAVASNIEDSLLKGMLLLPNYLSLLSAELQDHPLRLISTINELRIARGEVELNESQLFKPSFSIQLPETIVPNPNKPKPKLSVSPTKLGHIYQIFLVRWFKDNEEISLQRMGQIVNYLRLHSLRERSVLLWWAAAATIEALQDNGLIINNDVKSKIGKLSKPIELFTLHGEQELQALFPDQLLSELLLLIAHTTSSGKYVSLLRNTFKLDFFNTIQHQKIYNFSGNALANVHTELLEDLQAIKEQIDQFDRHSELSQNSFEQLPSKLTNIADTLQLLGENSSSALLLKQQSDMLSNLSEQQQVPDENQLSALADDILQIESLLRNISVDNEQSSESLELQKHVLGECLYELNSAKDTIAVLSEQPENSVQHLENISNQLKLVAGSLVIVNLNEAASLLDNTVQQIAVLEKNSNNISSEELTWLAEIIASCELYMEGIQHGASQQSQLLINAQSILINFDQSSSSDDTLFFETESDANDSSLVDNIETSVERYINNLQQDETVTGVERYIQQHSDTISQPDEDLEAPTSSSIMTGVELYIQKHQQTEKSQDEKTSSTDTSTLTSVEAYIQKHDQFNSTNEIETEKQTTAINKTSVDLYIENKEKLESEEVTVDSAPTVEDDIDDEIAEIFIEEANEVLDDFKSLIPEWLQNHDLDTLSTLRRHFHTLKGSGRMAGAHVIGELAWAIEDLLNHILEGSTSLSLEVDKLISETDTLIPQLLSRFTQRELASSEQVENLIALANNCQMMPELVLESEPDYDQTDEDDELQQIFNHEAAQHIATLTSLLDEQVAPYKLNKELLRAAHSLKGCANIAQVMPVAVVATQLDKTLRSLYEKNVSLDSEQLSSLTSVIDELEIYVGNLKKGPQEEQSDILPLAEKLIQLIPETVKTELKQEEDQEKLIDPEFLVVYLEETDDLLNQYNAQLESLQQQPDNAAYKSEIHSTLETLIDNAQHADLPALVGLYQLLDQLTQYSEPNHKDIVSLIEQCYEHINDQIELLIQNKPASDITEFKQQVEQRVNQVEEIAPLPEWFPLPTGETELLEAFTEELAELLESSEEAISRWQQNHDDNDAAQQLQRVLHTIKGGARLTDLVPIAEISHQTESLVFPIIDHKQAPNDAFFALLQQSQDRLAEIQERLANKESLPYCYDLLSEIAQFTGQSVVAPANPIPLADESTVADAKAGSTGGEQIRVRADLLDFLTNFTGEVNISRDRVGQQNSAILLQLAEMESTVSRLQDQLRSLEIETETQILFRYEDESHDKRSDFDPLEFDRFSMIQQLSRSLTESVSDMHEITQSIDNIVRDSDAILLQQSRLSADLEQGLMNTRLLPFTGLIPRFERIIRQVNSELDKQAVLTVHGADRELDRTILDRIVAPIEHLLRNAIAHGIESPDIRRQQGKSEAGQLTLSITREGSEILLSLSDDGQGINVEKVKQKAIAQNLINPDKIPSDEELIQLILSSGFSTSDDVSQISGRGVGMDVVSNEIRALKGRLSIQSVSGKGTTFNIRLPLTLSIMQSLMVSCNDKPYAIPLSAVHAGTRANVGEIQSLLASEGETRYEFNGEYYQFLSLAQLLDQTLTLPEDPKIQLPILLFRYGDMHVALLVDAVNSNREIVLKSVGEQLSYIDSINGATILGDGQVVFILDIPSLVEAEHQESHTEIGHDLITPVSVEDQHDRVPVAMVVDDSITMRKVSGNLLKRHGFEVITARDGIDAVSQLNEQTPDIILLDVEMPRMDGFEFATLVRNVAEYQNLPIIMITSRTGEKHRDRALSIGVNAYLGKPYQEMELVETMQNLLGNRYPNTKQ